MKAEVCTQLKNLGTKFAWLWIHYWTLTVSTFYSGRMWLKEWDKFGRDLHKIISLETRKFIYVCVLLQSQLSVYVRMLSDSIKRAEAISINNYTLMVMWECSLDKICISLKCILKLLFLSMNILYVEFINCQKLNKICEMFVFRHW
jgi:hypothetical protein